MDPLSPPEPPRDERDAILGPPPPVRRIVVDREPTVVQPPPANGHVPQAAAGAIGLASPLRRPRPSPGAEGRADADRGAVDLLRREGRRRRRHPAGPPGRGAGADRPLGLRQDDAAALAQPAGRDHPDGGPRRPHHARRRGHRPDGGDGAAAAGQHGLPAAQPVPDERLRQRRLRAARAGLAAARARTRCSTTSATRCSAPGSGTRSAPRSTTRRCGSPAASSSGSASPARWPPGPRCCCSTSPARRSTRARPR